MHNVNPPTLSAGLTLNGNTGVIPGSSSSVATNSDCSTTIKGSNADAVTPAVASFQVLSPAFTYPVVGAGVHVVIGMAVSIKPTLSGTSTITHFEAQDLPDGLSILSMGEIKGTVTGDKRAVTVKVKAFNGITLVYSMSFMLFVHNHNSPQPFVPSGSSCSFRLRMFATTDILSGAVYLDSADSTTTLGLTGLNMREEEVKSVFVCLPDAEYILHTENLNIVVLKGVNPVAVIGDHYQNNHFSTKFMCEELLDVECDIVAGDGVILKEKGAASGTTYSRGELVALNRSKTYEMSVCM